MRFSLSNHLRVGGVGFTCVHAKVWLMPLFAHRHRRSLPSFVPIASRNFVYFCTCHNLRHSPGLISPLSSSNSCLCTRSAIGIHSESGATSHPTWRDFMLPRNANSDFDLTRSGPFASAAWDKEIASCLHQ